MSLRVWLPLDGSLRNLGISEVSATANGATINATGKIGSCYVFDGSDDFISLIGSTLYKIFTGGSNAFSICMWIYHNDSTRAILFGDFGLSGNIKFNIELSTAHHIRFYWDGAPDKNFNADSSVGLQTWTHICLTYDGTILKLYKNGVLSTDTWTGPLTTKTKTSGAYYLGRDSRTGTTAFNGRLNDFRIYDHCLSAAEVKEIAQGLVLHYKLDGFFGGAGENLVINGDARNGLTGWSNWGTASSRQVITINNKKWFTFKTDANGNYGGFSQDRGIALYKPNTQYTISALMYASADASGRLWVHTRSTEGGANLAQYLTTVNVTTSPALYTFTFNTGSNASYTINKLNLMIGAVNTTSALDFYISNIKVEEGTKSTAWVPCKEEGQYDTTKVEDSSGYNHNGTINGTLTTSSDTVRYSSCVYMPKTTTITHQRPIYGGTDQEWTCCMWVKLDTTSQSIQQLNNFNEGNNIVHSANSTPLLYLNSGANDYYNYGNLAVSAGVWTHIAFVFKNSNATKLIYINGVNHTNTSGPNKTSTPKGIPDTITVGTNLAGYISDYRVYCTPLLDTDIKLLYNISMKVDNLGGVHGYTFNETNENILFNVEKARTNLIFTDGLWKYTQSNCQVTLTEQGYHIYRPPNLTTANDGNTMWGGLLINNQTTRTIAAYDASRDNIWNLQKNHTYIFAFHAKGQSSNSPSLIVESNMGWDRIAGVGPNPTYLASKTIPANFNGEQDCYIIFKIEDDIVKVATENKSSYVQGTSYLSYKELCLNYFYTATGTLGTDLYLTNFRLYDITDQISQIKKTGAINFSSLVEQVDKAQIRKNSELLATEFIEM